MRVNICALLPFRAVRDCIVPKNHLYIINHALSAAEAAAENEGSERE